MVNCNVCGVDHLPIELCKVDVKTEDGLGHEMQGSLVFCASCLRAMADTIDQSVTHKKAQEVTNEIVGDLLGALLDGDAETAMKIAENMADSGPMAIGILDTRSGKVKVLNPREAVDLMDNFGKPNLPTHAKLDACPMGDICPDAATCHKSGCQTQPNPELGKDLTGRMDRLMSKKKPPVVFHIGADSKVAKKTATPTSGEPVRKSTKKGGKNV